MYTRYKLKYKEEEIYFYLPENHGLIYDEDDFRAYLRSLNKSEFTMKDINNACYHVPCLVTRNNKKPYSLSEYCP